MVDPVLNCMMDRKLAGEHEVKTDILERLARDVYDNPRAFGLKTDDEVGEVMARYWPRITNLVDRYEDMGRGFDAYISSSLRYMGMSVRRKNQADKDRMDVLIDDGIYEAGELIASPLMVPVLNPSRTGTTVPWRDNNSLASEAFRRRLTFVCVKCAHLLSDAEAEAIALRTGMDSTVLLRLLMHARSSGYGIRPRSASRSRGRNLSWLDMMATSRRLERETDNLKRTLLEERILRDRRRYRSTVRRLRRSAPLISNCNVANLMGVSKGTVDSGVGRVMRQMSQLSRTGGVE